MSKLFWIAKRINYRHKKATKNFSIGIICSSVLALLLIAISNAIGQIYNHITENNIDVKQIVILDSAEDGFGNVYKSPIDKSLVLQIGRRLDVDQVVLKSQIISNDFAVMIDGYEIPVGGYVNSIDVQYETFSKKDLVILEDFDIENHIISGRDFIKSDTNKALIDENFVRAIGYQDIGDIIGKNITIRINNFSIEQIEIIGSYSRYLGSVPSIQMDYNEFDFVNDILEFGYDSPFILSSDIIQEIQEGNQTQIVTNSRAVIDIKMIKNVEEIYHFIELNTDNLVQSSLQESERLVYQMNNMMILIGFFVTIMFLLSFINITSHTISKLMSQRSFLKMLTIMGFRVKQIVSIYFFEIFYVLSKIFIFYTMLTYLFSLMIEFLLKQNYKVLAPDLDNVFILNWKYWIGYSSILFIVSTAIILLITILTLSNWNKRKEYIKL